MADNYFTEFNRLFNHYYRSIAESTGRAGTSRDHASEFLTKKYKRLKKYAPSTLRTKRVALLANMEGFANG